MVYLDHAASTPLRPEALEAMEPFLAHAYANPSGMHAAARSAKAALEVARETVASVCGCGPSEIVFTGGGSEADNLAVKGAAWAARDRSGRSHVVTTMIEHRAVLAAADRLEREGLRVERVGVDPGGRVDLDALAGALDDRTAVVSVMLVNNETGVVQPLHEVVEVIRSCAPRALIHTDAIQAVSWLDVRAVAADVDLLSISGHKFGGPKGVGALMVRKGVELVPLVDGGGQERELRAGTQNVAGIVGLAASARATDEGRRHECARVAALRDRLEAGLARTVPGFSVNGDPAHRIPGVLSCMFARTEAESLLVALDQRDVYASSGSACASGAIDPSHVLLAMGRTPEQARASVRFSLGHTTTDADIDTALAVIPAAVERLVGAAA
jgi:cysteine desulfurase